MAGRTRALSRDLFLALTFAGALGFWAVPFSQAREHAGTGHAGAGDMGTPSSHAQGATPPAGFEKGKKEGWKKKGTTTPPGWKKGKKKGWHGGSKPPGQSH